MFDAFPFDEWSEEIADFWTFGGANSTGTYIMTGIGVAAMLLAFIGFVWLENKKLEHQAAMLKASGGLERPAVVVTTVIPSD
jgi:ABC-type enterobactin transport system permease subunit